MKEDKLMALVKSLYTEVKSLREAIKEDIKAECRNIEEKLIGLGIMESEDEYWSEKDIMRKFGVSRTKIWNMRKSGILPFVKLGKGKNASVKYRPADVRIAFADKLQQC